MSLDYNLSKIQDWKNRCYIPCREDNTKVRVAPDTEAIIFATISVGMNTITESNWKEFYARDLMLQKLYSNQRLENMLKAEQIRAHIGLSTNASNFTRLQFLKGLNFWLDKKKKEVEHLNKK